MLLANVLGESSAQGGPRIVGEAFLASRATPLAVALYQVRRKGNRHKSIRMCQRENQIRISNRNEPDAPSHPRHIRSDRRTRLVADGLNGRSGLGRTRAWRTIAWSAIRLLGCRIQVNPGDIAPLMDRATLFVGLAIEQGQVFTADPTGMRVCYCGCHRRPPRSRIRHNLPNQPVKNCSIRDCSIRDTPITWAGCHLTSWQRALPGSWQCCGLSRRF